MNIQQHLRTPELQPNIALLDREFDAKPTEIDDFIFSHSQPQDENFYFMGFSTQTR